MSEEDGKRCDFLINERWILDAISMISEIHAMIPNHSIPLRGHLIQFQNCNLMGLQFWRHKRSNISFLLLKNYTEIAGKKMSKQCPQDYSRVAHQFRKKGGFKCLTSPILAASRCGDYFGPHSNYYDMPKDLVSPWCYQHSLSNKTASCHEIHRNLRAASRKSSILIPDTASKWYASQRKLKELLTNCGQSSPEMALMAYRQYFSQGQSLFIPPPIDRLNLKQPIRQCIEKKEEKSMKYMSPEFMELLRKHTESLKELHNLNALPDEYELHPTKPKISIEALRPTSSLAIRSEQPCKGGKMPDRRCTSFTKRSKKVVSEPTLHRKIKLSAVRARKSKPLQVIWVKPNNLEMRRSDVSVHLRREEFGYGTGMRKEASQGQSHQHKGAMRQETSTSDEESFPLSSPPKPRKYSMKALKKTIREKQLKKDDDSHQGGTSKSKRNPKKYSAKALKTRSRSRELEQDNNAPVILANRESTQKSHRASTSNSKRTSIAKLRMLRSNRIENRSLSIKETQSASRSDQSPLSKTIEPRKSPFILKNRRSLQQITEEKAIKPYKTTVGVRGL
ncbi:hypothetical protein GQX74_008625 [Glossina fuscipes]|nr:hypothetical protein GQX74_008625 [Glossina fuscipes]